MAGNRGSRHRSTTLASLPTFCACGGARRMHLVSLQGMRATGVTRCPHCNPEPGRHSIEIRTYRMRDDRPRGAA